jgi:phosphatidylserine/phosphatidylglycerophosphate/cardiolipin synthase-like enzyme
VPLRWVEDATHYDLIVDALSRARVSLWIATASLKDMRLEAPLGSVARARRRYVSIAERFAELRGRGIELRVLHGGAPSRPFRDSLAKRSQLMPTNDWLRQCPRVHLKVVAVDGSELYLGSANLTGAGMGAKGAGRRNFEVGVSTTDHVLLDAAQRRFDRIWTGQECGSCRVRASCPRPLDAGPEPCPRPPEAGPEQRSRRAPGPAAAKRRPTAPRRAR